MTLILWFSVSKFLFLDCWSWSWIFWILLVLDIFILKHHKFILKSTCFCNHIRCDEFEIIKNLKGTKNSRSNYFDDMVISEKCILSLGSLENQVTLLVGSFKRTLGRSRSRQESSDRQNFTKQWTSIRWFSMHLELDKWVAVFHYDSSKANLRRIFV